MPTNADAWLRGMHSPERKKIIKPKIVEEGWKRNQKAYQRLPRQTRKIYRQVEPCDKIEGEEIGYFLRSRTKIMGKIRKDAIKPLMKGI